jgi:type IV secretory pathway VirB10-like protein
VENQSEVTPQILVAQILDNNHRNLKIMAKKKKEQNYEAKEPVVPIKDVAKDIDDIFATKSVPKPASEEPVKSILNTPKPTTAMPDEPDEPEGQDLESVQSQVRAAKSSRVRPSSAVLKDDDFADIRGLKKRTPYKGVPNCQGNEQQMA